MCGIPEAKKQAKRAKELESTDPTAARNNYLEAAETLLYVSMNDKARKERLVKLAEEMYKKAMTLKAGGHEPRKEIVQRALKSKPEIRKKKTKGLNFNDIGGLTELKKQIRLKIIEPFLHPEIYKHFCRATGGGILMYGPPGCGKTMIAKATASEVNAKFFHVKASELKSKYVGETEQNISELFEKARASKPAVVFFDEFESIGMSRDIGGIHEKNMVAQLLEEMDGVDADNSGLLILAASNEPWSIDPALLRTGRLGTMLFIPPPDYEARKEIFSLQLKKRPTLNISYDQLADNTKNFSGADIKGICEGAVDMGINHFFESGELRKLQMDDFAKSTKSHRSTVIPWIKNAIRQVKGRQLEDTFPELFEKAEEMIV